MSRYHPALVAEIERFVAEVGISETTFGRRAVSDPHFLRDIRGTRYLRPETEAKVRQFMAEYPDAREHSPADTGTETTVSSGNADLGDDVRAARAVFHEGAQ